MLIRRALVDVPDGIWLNDMAEGWNTGAPIGCPHLIMVVSVYGPAQGFKPEWAP
jgi:hypothetical protein